MHGARRAHVIAITGSGTGRSVTNDVENVIADLVANGIDVTRSHVIYQDSEGYWDGIRVLDQKFAGFFPIRARELNDAWADVQSRRL